MSAAALEAAWKAAVRGGVAARHRDAVTFARIDGREHADFISLRLNLKTDGPKSHGALPALVLYDDAEKRVKRGPMPFRYPQAKKGSGEGEGEEGEDATQWLEDALQHLLSEETPWEWTGPDALFKSTAHAVKQWAAKPLRWLQAVASSVMAKGKAEL